MWQQFAEQQKLTVTHHKLSGYPSAWNNAAWENGYLTLLPDAGLALADGEDAAHFLHNQLSNDVEKLSINEVRRAAYCTPKGRMLASLEYWRTDAGIYLMMSGSIEAAVLKRLSMFILRAKAKLHDVTSQFVVFGLGGQQAGKTLATWFPELPAAAGMQISNAAGTLIRCSDVRSSPRYQWVCPQELAAQTWPVLSAQLQLTNTADWNLGEIEAGIAHIHLATQEKFVPQMINFELIGGVNFKKGCYPGQEIVARSQYLGKLKRRTFLASIPATGMEAGMDVYRADDQAQPCGVIVNAEPVNAASSLALIEMTIADQEHGVIHCGAPDGPVAQLLPLPYPITDITA